MAKRHHSSKRKHSGRHPEMMRDVIGHKSGYLNERNQDHYDAYGYNLLSEDHSAMANLPQGVKMMMYPRDTGSYLPMGYDDTLAGIDKQMRESNTEKMRYLKPRKA